MLPWGLLLLANARAAVPLVLPAGEVPADWETAAAMAGLEVRGAATSGPAVILLHEREQWTLKVRDNRGGSHVVPVDPPKDEAGREDVAWLAASLLDPLGSRRTTTLPTPSAAPAPAAVPAERVPVTPPVVSKPPAAKGPGTTTPPVSKAPAATPKPAVAAPVPAAPVPEPPVATSPPALVPPPASEPPASSVAVSPVPVGEPTAASPASAAPAPSPPPAVVTAPASATPGAVAAVPEAPVAEPAAGPARTRKTGRAGRTPESPAATGGVAGGEAPPALRSTEPAHAAISRSTIGFWAGGFGGAALRAGTDPAAEGGGALGIGRGSWRLGAGAVVSTPAQLDDLGPGQTMALLDLAATIRWRPDGRLAPTAGVTAGVSRRSYAAAGESVGVAWMPVVGADAGVSWSQGNVSIAPVLRTTYDLGPTALVRGDDTVLQGTLGIGLGLEVAIFFGPDGKS